MRIIGSLTNQKQAKQLSAYLRSIDIENTFEMSFDQETRTLSCSIWIHDEDKIDTAKTVFAAFKNNPEDEKFQVDLLGQEKPYSAIENPHYRKKNQKKKKQPLGLSAFIIFLCGFIFFLNVLQENKKSPEGKSYYVILTGMEKKLLYDVPAKLVALNKTYAKYGILRTTPEADVPAGAIKSINQALNLPDFQGLYPYIVASLQNDQVDESGPMFEKIRQGQIWRIFTPAIFHKNLLHIVLNMLWVWVLGRQIEVRLSYFRFILLMLIAAGISNTAQYLMSGPLFMGFSGVVLAMAGFIWMRQKIAPWEGYPLSKGILAFLLVFVFAMVVLQGISFFVEVTSGRELPTRIANTAHIAGGITGMILGRCSFFSWSVD